MALAAINGERLGHAMTADRLGEDGCGCLLVALFHEGDINGQAARIHSAIEHACYYSATFMDASSIRQRIDTGSCSGRTPLRVVGYPAVPSD
jgi:hypothetical protein